MVNKNDLCICEHTKYVHDYGICWGFGILTPNCSKKCIKFVGNEFLPEEFRGGREAPWNG